MHWMFTRDKLNRQQSAPQAYALTYFERKEEIAYYLGRICRFTMKSPIRIEHKTENQKQKQCCVSKVEDNCLHCDARQQRKNTEVTTCYKQRTLRSPHATSRGKTRRSPHASSRGRTLRSPHATSRGRTPRSPHAISRGRKVP